MSERTHIPTSRKGGSSGSAGSAPVTPVDTLPRADHGTGVVVTPPRRTLRGRAGSWFRAHRTSLIVAISLLLIVGFATGWDIFGAPQRIDDEGTYVAQAYAVQHFGSLAHYTYFYDHPPLGWIQIAAVTTVTGAFDWAPNAVGAGRIAMLVMFVAAAAIMWILGRRLRYSRTATSVAVALFGLSPLAIQYHRTVYLDNVAVVWLLAAFALALSPRHRLIAFAGSGLCFGIAVLSKETVLLMGPFLLWQLLRGSHESTRRYGVALASSIFVLCGVGYVLFAAVKGEALPGPGHVSLLDGIRFQLVSRTGSGNVFGADTLAHRVVANWLQLDMVFPAAAVLASVAGLFVRRLRPLAAALLFQLVVMLRPGYLPVPYVIVMLPFGALLVAGVAESALRWRRDRRDASGARTGPRWARRLRVGPLAPLVALAVVAGVVVGGPAWASKDRGLLVPDLDQPMTSAEAWIDGNVARDNRIIVDDALWVDLYKDGFPRSNVVWYYKLDTDPAVRALAPRGWRDYDYIVSTNSVRTAPNVSGPARTAVANSTVVATFGTGASRVEVRKINSDGSAQAAKDAAKEKTDRAQAGGQLAKNRGLALSAQARGLLQAGDVDPRLQVTLATIAAQHRLSIADFPAAAGQQNTGEPRRTVSIAAIDGRSLTGAKAAVQEVRAFFTGQPALYKPASITSTSDQLRITYPWPTPTGLLNPAS